MGLKLGWFGLLPAFPWLTLDPLNNLRSGKWSTASLNFAANLSNIGREKKLKLSETGIRFQDVTLQRVPGHIWAPPDFQHHSSVSGKFTVANVCVWHDGLWNKFLIRWAFVICGLGALGPRWSLVFQVVFLAVPRCCTTRYFPRDSCRTVVYQGYLFGRWASRCFQYLLQEELQGCVLKVWSPCPCRHFWRETSAGLASSTNKLDVQLPCVCVCVRVLATLWVLKCCYFWAKWGHLDCSGWFWGWGSESVKVPTKMELAECVCMCVRSSIWFLHTNKRDLGKGTEAGLSCWIEIQTPAAAWEVSMSASWATTPTWALIQILFLVLTDPSEPPELKCSVFKLAFVVCHAARGSPYWSHWIARLQHWIPPVPKFFPQKTRFVASHGFHKMIRGRHCCIWRS